MLDALTDATSPDNLVSSKDDTLPFRFRVEPPPIERLRKMFDDSRDATQANRLKQAMDRDYYDGPEQLNSDVRGILRGRGQPPIYTNRVRPAIDGILGVLDAAKVDPRGYPRTPSDENASDVATKALRFIADVSRFQETKLDCAENFLIEGSCASVIEFAGDEITVTQIRHEEFFYDPFSRRNDFKDAKYLGVAKWVDAADVKRQYPERYAAIGDPLTGGQNALDSLWQDRPDNFKPWVDKNRQRLMLIEVYYNEDGQWLRCVYCAQGVFEHDVSAYRNPITGETLCPIEAESCYVDRQNNRYGRVRDMIPIQDEINARRSRLLHLANGRQIQEVQLGAAQVDAETARTEAARADGVIPSGWQLVPTNDLASGQQLLLAESKSEIERMGPTPAVLGRQGDAAQSGRARLVLQQAGMTELARPLGRLEDWETRCYRQMWLRAQQFKTAPWFIRVTDDARAPDFLQVNEPVTLAKAVEMAVQGDQKAVEGLSQVIPPEVLQAAKEGDQRAVMMIQQMVQVNGQMPVMVRNRIAQMDLDIIIETMPDTANLQQEVWQDLLSLGREIGIGTPQFMIALEIAPIPDKMRIIERLKAWQQEQQGQPDPLDGKMKELAVADAEANVEATQAKAGLDRAKEADTMFALGHKAAGVPDAPQMAAAA